ncbi:LAME_0H19768g1_1 [Lachancea meyersii CBS 8951]|uniref:LAME_0H19768g1_1 n=1 Tax=Lachancea meyersii CBS 8951 TaxID=1266667 RepID=A0A1G4KJ98_9SACH|nr:LAME_0H19768g1_1 [Lachancea meyersii CBS 8951]
MSELRVGVEINTVQIVKRSYALYRIDLILNRPDGEKRPYHAFRRFSEFIKLRQDLESEMGSELPYELPPRILGGWLKPSGSCDPDVIELRKKELTRFLNDLLNDSFDSRWKRSPYVCHFLQLPSSWEDLKPRGRNSAFRDLEGSDTSNSADLKDPQRWLEELRNCKILLAEAARDHSAATKIGIQLRLRIQNLEVSLKNIAREQLVGASEIKRRHNLLSGLKTDLNEKLVKTNSNAFDATTSLVGPNEEETHHDRPLLGRKIGETSQTLGLNDQDLLQLHKDTTQQQDLELEQLRKIILNQKQLSLSMNQELTQQNELLDLMSGEVESTANKLRMANRGAKRFNDN